MGAPQDLGYQAIFVAVAPVLTESEALSKESTMRFMVVGIRRSGREG